MQNEQIAARLLRGRSPASRGSCQQPDWQVWSALTVRVSGGHQPRKHRPGSMLICCCSVGLSTSREKPHTIKVSIERAVTRIAPMNTFRIILRLWTSCRVFMDGRLVRCGQQALIDKMAAGIVSGDEPKTGRVFALPWGDRHSYFAKRSRYRTPWWTGATRVSRGLSWTEGLGSRSPWVL
jgi:hypothetical protein